MLGKLSNPFTENGELRFQFPRGQCAIEAENQTLRGGGRWQKSRRRQQTNTREQIDVETGVADATLLRSLEATA